MKLLGKTINGDDIFFFILLILGLSLLASALTSCSATRLTIVTGSTVEMKYKGTLMHVDSITHDGHIHATGINVTYSGYIIRSAIWRDVTPYVKPLN